MISIRKGFFLGCLAVFTLPGCNPSGSVEVPECTGGVTMTVSEGAKPTFSWTPACPASALLVEESPADMWYVLTLGANNLAAPLTYGVIPAGAIEEYASEPLVVGKTYNVILYRRTGSSDEIIATKEFTP